MRHTTESMNCAGFCATLKLMAVQFFDIIQTYLFYSPGYFIVRFFSRGCCCCWFSFPLSTKHRQNFIYYRLLQTERFIYFFFYLALLLASTVRSLNGQNPSLINPIFSQVQVERYTVVYCKLCARTGAPCVCVLCTPYCCCFSKSNGNSLSHCHQPPSASISINKKLCWTTKLSN